MSISVIIVNYNTTNHLINCLETLLDINNESLYEIIVVDNNSSDRNIENIINQFPNVKFLLREINDGFGGGCNYGSKYASGKYLLFLNPDITFIEKINKKLIDNFDEDEKIGLISPIYPYDEEGIIFTNCDFPGYNSEIKEVLGINISKYLTKLSTIKKIDESKTFEVNWVMGSHMLLRNDLFKLINGFDENYFMYYEDIDLQYRIKQLGFKILYDPNTKVKHIKRSSVRTFSGENFYYFHMTRSKLIYMYKHLGFKERNIIRAVHILGLILRILYLPFNRTYIKKKKQKLLQYLTKIKQYLSIQKCIQNSKYSKIDKLMDEKTQITNNDNFWKNSY